MKLRGAEPRSSRYELFSAQPIELQGPGALTGLEPATSPFTVEVTRTYAPVPPNQNPSSAADRHLHRFFLLVAGRIVADPYAHRA